MIRDEDGALTGYVYIDLNTRTMAGLSTSRPNCCMTKLQLPAGYTYQWSGEYEFELRAQGAAEIHSAGRVFCRSSCCCTWCFIPSLRPWF